VTTEAAQEPQDPTKRQLTIRVLAMPADANPHGDIFGGWLMSQIDIAGSVVAIQTAQGRVVTVAVNEMRFILPVFVGDLVSLYARLKQVGRTSVTVEVEAFAEREQERNQLQRVATATLTYVAVDGNGRPRAVSPP
jgi:acyl-CoA thioesterase YciA